MQSAQILTSRSGNRKHNIFFFKPKEHNFDFNTLCNQFDMYMFRFTLACLSRELDTETIAKLSDLKFKLNFCDKLIASEGIFTHFYFLRWLIDYLRIPKVFI